MAFSSIFQTEKLLFGTAPRPVSCGRGIVIGAGTVYPEINFTLPTMDLERVSRGQVEGHYRDMLRGVCRRAVDLKAPGIVVEVELLPPMTMDPVWGGDITGVMTEMLDEFHAVDGLRSALRMTPVDVRDTERPPRMRTGVYTRKTLSSFEECARNGADLLSIESTGGKELHDEALLAGDLLGIVYALGVLAPRDMNFLWKEIVAIGAKYGSIPAGDTACGFSNTAMVLADKGMIPRVLAAVDRVASVVRSLQAYIQGAVGPSKDCAYEGPYIKAMTGVPISMEGKSSACAHLTHLGNIAGACCDLWSNESVQNVRLLSAHAPIVSMEQLVYDCRLMNKAAEGGEAEALRLQSLMVESDASLDPQAYILRPDVVTRISEKMARCESPLAMTLCAVDETIIELEQASAEGRVQLNNTEKRWLGMLAAQRETIPEDEDMMLEMLQASNPELNFIPAEYGIE